MTYTVTLDETNRRLDGRLQRLLSQLAQKRAVRRNRVQQRRNALAVSEEARINAQMRHHRTYRRIMAT